MVIDHKITPVDTIDHSLAIREVELPFKVVSSALLGVLRVERLVEVVVTDPILPEKLLHALVFLPAHAVAY